MPIFCCAILRRNGEVIKNNSLFSHTMQFHVVQHNRLKELAKSSQHGRTQVKKGSSIGGSSVTHSLERRSRISLESMRDRAKFIGILACLPLNVALERTQEQSAHLCILRRSHVWGYERLWVFLRIRNLYHHNCPNSITFENFMLIYRSGNMKRRTSKWKLQPSDRLVSELFVH